MFAFGPPRRDSRQNKRHILLRAALAGLFALLGFALLGGRLWYLQVANYDALALRADRNRIAVVRRGGGVGDDFAVDVNGALVV